MPPIPHPKNSALVGSFVSTQAPAAASRTGRLKGAPATAKHIAVASKMRPCLVVSLCRENIGNTAEYARGERNVYLCGPGRRQDLGFALHLIFAETDAGVSPEPRKSYVFERLSKLRPIDASLIEHDLHAKRYVLIEPGITLHIGRKNTRYRS